MKRCYLPLEFLLVVLILASVNSCKKDRVEDAPKSGSVEIGGSNYATLKFGSQTWTIENYIGSGGTSYDQAGTRPEYGKYYSYNEIKAIVIPTGWRIPKMNDFIKLGESQGVIFTNSLAKNQEACKKIVSTSRWLHVIGNNQSGFNAYPANYFYLNSKPVEGDISEFWTAEGSTFSIQELADGNSLRMLFYNDSSADGYKFNLRFVKDN